MRGCRLLDLVMLGVAMTAGAGCARMAAEPAGGRDMVEEFSFDGRARTYLLHVPPGYDGKKPVPLVVVLHYYTGTGQAEAEQSLFSEKADAESFIAVYPNGALRQEPGFSWSFRQHGGIDDVAFVGEVIQRLSGQYAIDRKRIYVTGMSQGGILAHAVGCELSSVVAAIAPVGAALLTEPTSPDPVSVLIVHGTEDPSFPYEGREPDEGEEGLPCPSVSEVVATWVKHNGCGAEPERRQQGKIIREVYSGGRGGTEVVLCAIVGGRHDWPGDNNDRTNSGLVGADEIWDFFARHPKQEERSERLH